MKTNQSVLFIMHENAYKWLYKKWYLHNALALTIALHTFLSCRSFCHCFAVVSVLPYLVCVFFLFFLLTRPLMARKNKLIHDLPFLCRRLIRYPYADSSVWFRTRLKLLASQKSGHAKLINPQFQFHKKPSARFILEMYERQA